MTTATFDALGYSEKLKNAGFTEEQARIQGYALKGLLDEKAIARESADIGIGELELRLEKEIREARNTLLKWQIGMGIMFLLLWRWVLTGLYFEALKIYRFNSKSIS